MSSLERDGLRQADRLNYIKNNKPNESLILDRSQPGLTMTVPTVGH